MWTTTITEVEKLDQGRGLRVAVLFDNGTEKFEEDFFVESGGITPDKLKQRIQGRIDALTAIDALATFFTPGPIDPTVMTDKPPV